MGKLLKCGVLWILMLFALCAKCICGGKWNQAVKAIIQASYPLNPEFQVKQFLDNLASQMQLGVEPRPAMELIFGENGGQLVTDATLPSILIRLCLTKEDSGSILGDLMQDDHGSIKSADETGSPELLEESFGSISFEQSTLQFKRTWSANALNVEMGSSLFQNEGSNVCANLQLRDFCSVCRKYGDRLGTPVGFKGFTRLVESLLQLNFIEGLKCLLTAITPNVLTAWEQFKDSGGLPTDDFQKWTIELFDVIRFSSTTQQFEETFRVIMNRFRTLINYNGPHFAKFVTRTTDQAPIGEKPSFAYYYIRIALLEYLLFPHHLDAKNKALEILSWSPTEKSRWVCTVAVLNFFLQSTDAPTQLLLGAKSEAATEIVNAIRLTFGENLAEFVNFTIEVNAPSVLELLVALKALGDIDNVAMLSIIEQAVAHHNGVLLTLLVKSKLSLVPVIISTEYEVVSPEAALVLDLLMNEDVKTFMFGTTAPCGTAEKENSVIKWATPYILFSHPHCYSKEHLRQLPIYLLYLLFGIPVSRTRFDLRVGQLLNSADLSSVVNSVLNMYCHGSGGTEFVFESLTNQRRHPTIPLACHHYRSKSW